jgi:hypothetical protein
MVNEAAQPTCRDHVRLPPAQEVAEIEHETTTYSASGCTPEATSNPAASELHSTPASRDASLMRVDVIRWRIGPAAALEASGRGQPEQSEKGGVAPEHRHSPCGVVYLAACRP